MSHVVEQISQIITTERRQSNTERKPEESQSTVTGGSREAIHSHLKQFSLVKVITLFGCYSC